MTKIYLIRHAEAEGNAYRRIHGQYNSRVTEHGLKQIEALKKRFADIRIDACYASDLNRTCVTARSIYVPQNLPLHTDKRFREVCLGRWEDTPFGWLERFEPEGMQMFNHDALHWSVEGSETYEVHSTRILEAMTQAAEANPDKTIAIFSHGCVLRGLQYRLLGEKWPPYCENTGVSLLEYENGVFRPVFLNDASHLPPELSTLARQSWWRKDGAKKDFNLWFEEDGNGLIAYLRDEAVGRVQSHVMEDDSCRIDKLWLDEEHRGRDLGAQLLGCVVSQARKAGKQRLVASVQEDDRALHFFLRRGFKPVGTENGRVLLDKSIRLPQE